MTALFLKNIFRMINLFDCMQEISMISMTVKHIKTQFIEWE